MFIHHTCLSDVFTGILLVTSAVLLEARRVTLCYNYNKQLEVPLDIVTQV